MTSLTSSGALAASVPPLSSIPALPTSDRFASPVAKARQGNDSRAAWLVLLTQDDGTRALLFNAAHRYLAEVIDDPLTVEHLCSAGRRCAAPAELLATLAETHVGATDVQCVSLGHH